MNRDPSEGVGLFTNEKTRVEITTLGDYGCVDANQNLDILTKLRTCFNRIGGFQAIPKQKHSNVDINGFFITT